MRCRETATKALEDDPVAVSSAELRLWRVGIIVTILAVLLALRFASRPIQDASGYVLFTIGTCVLGYYSVRALTYYRWASEGPTTSVVNVRAKSPIWLYTGCASALVGFVLNVLFLLKLRANRNAQSEMWVAAFGCCAVGTLYSWLGAYQLRITDDAIEYWSLTTGHERLEDEEMSGMHLGMQGADGVPRVLEIARRNSRKRMVINLRVFQEADIKTVMEWVKQRQ